jgi:hypothetical protein
MKLAIIALSLFVSSCAEKVSPIEMGVAAAPPTEGFVGDFWEYRDPLGILRISDFEETSFGGQRMWVFVKGRLPLGTASLVAVGVDGAHRLETQIDPSELRISDPEADRWAYAVSYLKLKQDWYASLGRSEPRSSFSTGTFDLYLVSSEGDVLASTEVTLIE